MSLILGNCQTQVYFRVAREDAERLAKESHNIIKQLVAQDDKLMQDPERKFSLQEMWEVAFHGLARLEQRQAYVMVKGEMEHPEKIRTADLPLTKFRAFPYDDSYLSLDKLQAARVAQSQLMESAIVDFIRADNEGRSSQRRSAAIPEEPAVDLDAI